MKFDLFISHASEDKARFVRPLAKKLTEFGLKVWYDEFELKPGDSLSRSIDKGLTKSKYGLVILSPIFFKKGWTEYELKSLLAKEIGNKKVIIPVWYKLTKNELRKYSLYLSDKLAINSDKLRLVELCVNIISVVRPKLFEKIHRRVVELKHTGEPISVETKKILLNPPVHDKLPPDLIRRIRLIRAALLRVDPHSMEYWIDGFRADRHPTREIAIWEHIAACFIEYSSMTKLTAKQIKSVFTVCVRLSAGENIDDTFSYIKCLPADAKEKIGLLWSYSLPVYDIEDVKFPSSYESTDKRMKDLEKYDKEIFPFDVSDKLIQELIKKK